MKQYLRYAAAICGIVTAPFAQGAQVFNDPFTDGVRTEGSDPLDAPWYSITGAGTTLSVVNDNVTGGLNSGNALKLTATSNSQGFVAQLPAGTTLADGGTLTLSFAWRFTGTSNLNQAGRLRFGLYNSNGTPTVSDAHTSIRNNDQGYYSSTNPGSASATGTSLQEETTGSEILISTGITTIGTTGASISAGTTPHTALLTLTRVGATVNISSSIDGQAAATASVSAPLTYVFDSVAISIGIGNYTTPSPLIVDDVIVDYTPPAPPSGNFINLSGANDFAVPANITYSSSTDLGTLCSLATFRAIAAANRYVYSFETWPETANNLGLNDYTFKFDLDGNGTEDQQVKITRYAGFTLPQLTKGTNASASSPSTYLAGLGEIGWNSANGSVQRFDFQKPVSAFGAVFRSPAALRLMKSNDYPVEYTLTDGSIVRLGASGVLASTIAANTNAFVGIQDTTGKGIVSAIFRFRGTLTSANQQMYLDDLAFATIPEPAVTARPVLTASRDFRNPASIVANASLTGLCSLQQFRDLALGNKYIYTFNTWPQATNNLGANTYGFQFDLDGDGDEDQGATISYSGTYSGTTNLTKGTLAAASSPNFVLDGLGNVGGTAYAEHTIAFTNPVSAMGFVYHSPNNLRLQRTGGFPVSYVAGGQTYNLGSSGVLGATLAGGNNTWVGLIDPTGKGITSVTVRVMGTAAGSQAVYIDDLAFVNYGPPLGNWTLWLNEEFNGTSLDPQIWYTGQRFAGSINNELQAYRPENVIVENGLLKLRTSQIRGAINNAAGYPVGATVINIDGFTQAIPDGSVVRIGAQNFSDVPADDRLYTVLSSVGGSTPTQITLTEGLRQAATDNLRVVLTRRMQDMTGYESGRYDFSSGLVQTFNKWTQKYGYWEARIKMPEARGTWPAFWTMPDRGPEAVKNLDKRVAVGTSVNGVSMPMGNELDITEFMSAWKNAAGNYLSHSGHIWRYSSPNNPGLSRGDYSLVNDGWGPGEYFYPNATTEFHTYGMLWSPTELVFYIDGRPVVRNVDIANLCVVPSYILLNVAIRGDQWRLITPLEDIDADHATPKDMEIDYVKVWVDNTLPVPTEYVIDDKSGSGITTTGSWTGNVTTPTGHYYGDYRHDNNTAKGTKSIRVTPNLFAAGNYEVFAWWPASTGNSNAVPYDITHTGGVTTVTRDQQTNGGTWVSLGTYNFASGQAGNVLIRTTGTSGRVVWDAMKFVRQ